MFSGSNVVLSKLVSFSASRTACCTAALLCVFSLSQASAQVGEMEMEASPIDGVQFVHVASNGIKMRVAVAGDIANKKGPMVLLAHGWPESWYSWRHQIVALSAAGYRVAAPDMRGYGGTDAPLAEEDYNIVTLAADMVGVLDALGESTATIVGHDWGSPVAAHAALLHPHRFTRLVLMSVPYRTRGPVDPLAAMTARVGDNFFYMAYHNEAAGVAEKEYDSDPAGILSRLYLSPDSPRHAPEVTDPKRAAGGWIPRLGAPKGLPEWLRQEDLDYVVTQFETAGFRGGVNYYRNLGRNWALMTERDDHTIRVPTLFIAGSKDVVIGGADASELAAVMKDSVADLRDIILVADIGHWIQQEAPEATNAALLKFLSEP
jgi:pimeloyl-ACP methyl ester carboxylesterase